MAADHCAKKEIIKLEEELPKWRTIINTGAPPGTHVQCSSAANGYIKCANTSVSGAIARPPRSHRK